MVRFSAYVIFMACFSVIAYFIMGPCSTIGGLVLTAGSGSSACSIIANPQEVGIGAFLSNNMVGILAASLIIGAGILFVSGFAIIYIVPIALAMGVLSFFVFPFGIFINSSYLDPSLGVPLMFIFNTIMILSVADFIKGGA